MAPITSMYCHHFALPAALLAVCLTLSTFTATRASAALPPGVVDTQRSEDKPLPPLDALARMTVPDGFRVTLFAGEPDIHQPIAFAFDDRGRLWVVECYSYPKWETSRDRIVILEDTDQDGDFDERTIFYDAGHRFTSIELGFGGVWVTAAPHLLFIPDRDRDDVPDAGGPVVKLEGFTLGAAHNQVNGLIWGPDGWLYGRHGILAESKVMAPGGAAGAEVRINCGIWRYHPLTAQFEVVAHGTTNPWGLDFDEHGQFFFSNNVIGHLWHLIPGAHYKRMYGTDYNPNAYELMEAASDHLHWGGADWREARGGRIHHALGGGHAHSGAMIYLGDNWPARYRGSIFMSNLHGNRVLHDRLERRGSGYVGRHEGDLLLANDPWFRGVMIQYGPDGGVFVSDWNDLGECHDDDGAHRSSGRVYKITHGEPNPVPGLDLGGETDAGLVRMQLHRSDWFVRHARRLLQERAAAGGLDPGTVPALFELLETAGSTPLKLRALWALHVTGALAGSPRLESLLGDSDEQIRWWAVQLLAGSGAVEGKILRRFEEMAGRDESALVRLALASALQRLPLDRRWALAVALLGREEDSKDQNLPLMIWYAVEPLVAADKSRALELVAKARIPQVRTFLTRRLTHPE